MRMLLSRIQSSGQLFPLQRWETPDRSSWVKGPGLLLLGQREAIISPQGEVEKSGWSALAQSPGFTGNPHFSWVTQSLC